MNKTIGLLTVAVAALLPPSVGMSQQVVRWEPTLESAQRLAAQTNRLVLIYFSGPSCAYCRKMEAEVLSQPAVAAAVNGDYVAVQVTADYFPTTAKRYNITHLPTTVITTPQGQWIDSKEGYVAANEYVARLGQVAADVKQRRAAALAQIPNGPTPPVVNQPLPNQPVANQPVAAQPMANQPVANQPMVNQPIAAQSPPAGQPPRPIASPPAMTQQFPPTVNQQQPPALPTQNQQQVAVAPPQNNVGPIQNNLAPPAPPANPPIGLDGCCPVSLVEKQKWVAGDRRWGVNHRGRLYFFAGPEEQRRFFTDPDRYAPVVSGNDIVLATEGQVASGRREFGVYYRNRVYLFSSEASRAKFESNPAAYANQALEALRASAAHPGGAQWR